MMMERFLFSESAKYLFSLWEKEAQNAVNLCPLASSIDFDTLSPTYKGDIGLSTYPSDDAVIVMQCATNVAHDMKQDFNGHNILSYLDAEEQKKEKEYYLHLKNTCSIGLIRRRITDINHRQAVFSVMHLPMVNYNNEITYFLYVTSLTIENKPLETPRLFIIQQSKVIDCEYVPVADLHK